MIIHLLKFTGLLVAGVAILFFLFAFLFVKLSPEFGANLTDDQKEKYSKSKQYRNGHFSNKEEVHISFTFGQYVENIIRFFRSEKNTIPNKLLPIVRLNTSDFVSNKSDEPLVIWFGHSAVFLRINNENILIDPMFGDVPAPHPWLGKRRFSKKLPIDIENLPNIDAVIFTHDHYDHLDYGSILKLKSKVNRYYTPLGVGNHLIKWGIDSNKINELDWWDETRLGNLQLICTPAQHFSGRGLSDRGATLWSSWVIKTEEYSIFFSGDSGYNTHFKEIGEKYGPFDFALMECGQYNEQWKQIHMLPEETVQASLDVKAKQIMPIHWAAFKLAFHTWTDPVERLTRKAKELKLNVITPMIGQKIIISKPPKTIENNWWIGI